MIDSSAFRQFADERVVIMSAPNGARRMPADHQDLPLTADALASTAVALLEQSVSVLHLHVRDADNRHSLDVERYQNAISAIRKQVGDKLLIQVTTEAVGQYQPQQQMQMVKELRPEAVSLALRELCASDTDELIAADFFAWIQNERIWPQYILYTVDDVERFDRLRRKGLFSEDHPFCLLVLGQYVDGKEGAAVDLDNLLAAADFSQFAWSACCFGAQENAVVLAADERNGHVRIGFENNLYLQDGTVAKDNAALVEQFMNTRSTAARPPAAANDVREKWLANR